MPLSEAPILPLLRGSLAPSYEFRVTVAVVVLARSCVVTPYRAPSTQPRKPPAPPPLGDRAVLVFAGISCLAAVAGVAWIYDRLPRLDGGHGALEVGVVCLAATARR